MLFSGIKTQYCLCSASKTAENIASCRAERWSRRNPSKRRQNASFWRKWASPKRKYPIYAKIYTGESEEKYFISDFSEDIPLEIMGEELARSSENNVYSPRWVDTAALKTLVLFPPQLKEYLTQYSGQRLSV